MENPHFKKLVHDGQIFWREQEPPPEEKFTWLCNRGQWGTPGWSMESKCVQRIARLARMHAGQRALEIGTSRGRVTAVLNSYGCLVTTVDRVDRGAAQNLQGLNIDFVIAEATAFLRMNSEKFRLIVVDLHDNSVAVWKELWPLLVKALEQSGTLALYNSHLWKIPEWHEETGLKWVAETKLEGWCSDIFPEPPPGMMICRPTSGLPA
jgi:hypothetical protein